MPSASVQNMIPYRVMRTSLYGPTAGQSSVSETGTSLTLKRSRSWSVQPRPYTKTLGYTDHKSELTVNAYSYLRRMLVDTKWLDYDFFTSPVTATGAADLEWLEAHSLPSLTAVKNRIIEEAGGITWSLPVFAAEAGKTGDMMFNAAKTIVKAYKQARRGNFRAMLKTFGLNNTKGVAGNWLGYRYGVCTTLLDVQSMAQAAAETLVSQPQVQRIVCRGPTIQTPYSGYTTTLGKAILTSNENRWQESLIKLETKAWLTLMVSNKTLLTMNRFGLANPALVAWELIPLSFVADWALGVGDWLAAQTGLLGLTVLDGGTSQLSSRTLSVRSMNKTSGSYRTVMNIAPCIKGISRKYVRSPWNGSAPPIRLGLNMSTNRFIDSAALIRGFLKSL